MVNGFRALFIAALTLVISLVSAVAMADTNIPRLSASAILDRNISDEMAYFALPSVELPNDPQQLDRLLGQLSPLGKPNTFGDRFIAVVDVTNDTDNQKFILHPYGSVVDHIEIHWFDQNQHLGQVSSGHNQPSLPAYHYGGEFSVPKGSSVRLVMLYESDYFFAPIRTLILPTDVAENRFRLENTILVLALGVCLALGIYNLLIYQGSREKQYLYYALSTLVYMWGWGNVFGVTQEFFGNFSSRWLMPPYVIGSFISCFFIIEFLQLRRRSPKTAKSLRISATIIAVCLPLSLLSQGLGLYLASLSSSLVLAIGLYAGARAWYEGFTPARYFVMAFLAVLLPNMVGNLMNLGILPGLNINIYLLGLLGNCADSLLLAFALADKVQMLNRQNIELTTQLESKVAQRTKELSLANGKLEGLIDELTEANKSKSRFLANMSHEIRTPLTSIIGYADGILHGDVSQYEQSRVIKIISDNGNHLLNVINDILDISKIEANRLDFEFLPTPLFSILAQIESLVGKRARDKGLAFHLDYQYPLPAMIVTDPTRLKQILFNLTNNAIKFTEQGYVGLTVCTQQDRLIVRVKDSGMGISAEQQAMLFNPFTQADSSINRRFGGTGLGLSISQKLADGLDGEIRVSSEQGKGSTFTLDVKLNVATGSEWIASISEIWKATPSSSLKETKLPDFNGSQVLLADDHPTNRELIALLLKRMNIRVVEVSNGLEAVEKASQQRFDLILMDIHMPEMDGLHALKRIRASGNYTPVIALTANNMKHEVESYLQAGFADHLAKPLARHHFIEKLRTYLSSSSNNSNPLTQNDMLKLVADYVQDLIRQLDSVEDAWNQRDYLELAEMAHRIKGTAGSFGFAKLGLLFSKQEQYAKEEDELAIHSSLPDVLSYGRLCTQLPCIDIASAILNFNINADTLLQQLPALVQRVNLEVQQTQAAIQDKQWNAALLHINNALPDLKRAAIDKAEAFEALEMQIKQGALDNLPDTHWFSQLQSYFEQLQDWLNAAPAV